MAAPSLFVDKATFNKAQTMIDSLEGAKIRSGIEILLRGEQPEKTNDNVDAGQLLHKGLTSLVATPHFALNIPIGATTSEVRKAYRQMALLYHPDKNPKTTPLFQAIQTASDKLSNTFYRKIEEEKFSAIPTAAKPPTAPTTKPQQQQKPNERPSEQPQQSADKKATPGPGSAKYKYYTDSKTYHSDSNYDSNTDSKPQTTPRNSADSKSSTPQTTPRTSASDAKSFNFEKKTIPKDIRAKDREKAKAQKKQDAAERSKYLNQRRQAEYEAWQERESALKSQQEKILKAGQNRNLKHQTSGQAISVTKPVNLRPSNIETNSVELTWEVPQSAEKVMFELSWRNTEFITNVWECANFLISGNKVKKKNLNEGTKYQFRVRAVVDEEGILGNCSDWSNVLSIATLSRQHPKPTEQDLRPDEVNNPEDGPPVYYRLYSPDGRENFSHPVYEDRLLSSTIVGYVTLDSYVESTAIVGGWLKVKCHLNQKRIEPIAPIFGWCLRSIIDASGSDVIILQEIDNETTATDYNEYFASAEIWHELFDENGRKYYYNEHSQESKWEPPEWVEEVDPGTGARYYVNSVALNSTWTKPKAFATIIHHY